MAIKEQRIIIAGSREGFTQTDVDNLMNLLDLDIDTVISGMARGVDAFGYEWARQKNIQVLAKPADWERYGKSAGYRRNVEMAEQAHGLVALWDGKSRGTKHMIEIARDKGLHIWLYEPGMLRVEIQKDDGRVIFRVRCNNWVLSPL